MNPLVDIQKGKMSNMRGPTERVSYKRSIEGVHISSKNSQIFQGKQKILAFPIPPDSGCGNYYQASIIAKCEESTEIR